MSPAAAVAAWPWTMVAVKIKQKPKRDRLLQKRPLKTATSLPTLLPPPRLTPPSPTPDPIKPDELVRQQNEDEEKGDVGGYTSVSTVADVLQLMDALCLPVEADLYASLIKECIVQRNIALGSEVHAHIRRSFRCLLGEPRNPVLANRLLLMYTASGRIQPASEMFDGMSTRGPIPWAIMIAAQSDAGNHQEALRLFAEMMHEQGSIIRGGTCILTMATVLRSCTIARDLQFGLSVHGLVLKSSCLGRCAVGRSRMESALIHFYGMLGQEDSADKVFDSLNNSHDSVIWNAILAYCELGIVSKALELFALMRGLKRKQKDSLFSSILRVCGRKKADLPGRQIHAYAIKLGLDSNRIARCSLMELYRSCGLVFDTRRAELEVTQAGAE